MSWLKCAGSFKPMLLADRLSNNISFRGAVARSVVECLTLDREVAGSSFTVDTALCP